MAIGLLLNPTASALADHGNPHKHTSSPVWVRPPIPGYALYTTATDPMQPSLLTAGDINGFLSGSPMAGTGSAFMAAERQSGFSARFLIAVAYIESGLGSGPLAQATYNAFSVEGSAPGTWAQFSSFNQAILDEGQMLDQGYSWPGVTIAQIGAKYATDSLWAQKVASAANLIPASSAAPYAASLGLGLAQPLGTMTPASLSLSLTNQGWVPWADIGAQSIAVVYSWSAAGQKSPETVAVRYLAAPGLYSGGSAALRATLAVPQWSGRYHLGVQVFLQGNRWRVALGSWSALVTVLGPAFPGS